MISLSYLTCILNFSFLTPLLRARIVSITASAGLASDMDHSDDTERRLSALERHVQALTQSQLNLQPATLTAATDPMETATSSLGLDVHTALLANAPGATAATPGGTAETEGRTELRAEVWRQDPGVMAQLKQVSVHRCSSKIQDHRLRL